MDRGAWWATVHGVPKSRTRLKQCNTHSPAIETHLKRAELLTVIRRISLGECWHFLMYADLGSDTVAI